MIYKNSARQSIRFCLQLNGRSHIGVKEFEKLNWPPVSERFNQYLCFNIFTFLSGNNFLYLHNIYKQLDQDQARKRSSVLKLTQPSINTCPGQKTLSYLTPALWNNLPPSLKVSNSLNSFKHSMKEHYF